MTTRATTPSLMPALVVILAGVSAALHVGKLSPALPVLRDALHISLLQAGFLLSLVQLAGMALGLVVGLAADGFGLKRSLIVGLLVLFGAGALGGYAQSAADLLALRALEGVGFLLVSMPAPSLIRHLVAPANMNSMLGLWGAYMPFGAAASLLCGPLFIATFSWQAWWWLLAVLSLIMAVWVWRVVPPDATRVHPHAPTPWATRLRQTLTAGGPWLVALSFAMYSGQWLAVIGFLPSIYTQAGVSGGVMAVLTAGAAAVNMVGNIASGRLLQRGVNPQVLLTVGFSAMALGTVLAFATWPVQSGGAGLPPAVRYLAVLLFSAVGGVIPGTLFSLAVRMAPGEKTISTTVGWMQQWSAFGQLAGPPLVAVVASRVGGWQWTWAVTVTCSLLGIVLARRIGRALRGSVT